jgi:hypothetical protein
MPMRQLPNSPDLRHLKLQAKSLLKDFRSGQPDAQTRLAPLCSKPEDATLSKAQTTIAREYGLRSWPQLLARVEALLLINASQNPPPPVPGPMVLEQLVELLPQNWVIARTLIRAGEPGIDALINGLAHRSAKVRGACANVFDHHRHPRGVAALRQHVTDRVPRVRRKVIHSLGCERCSGDPLDASDVKAVQYACLNDESPRVRSEAGYLLGQQVGDTDARATLLTMLVRETDPQLLAMAQLGLSNHARACLGGKTEVAVRESIGEPERIAEKVTHGPPRMLYWPVSVLASPGKFSFSTPVWLRLIIKNGLVTSVKVIDEKRVYSLSV